jgi:histidyl-tRNA synthetase
MSEHTRPARGMRDFLPEDVRRRDYVIDIVKDVYRRYGFEPLETPSLENIETLTGKYGEEGNKLIFKVLRRGEHEASGETDLALRYDLTVPLARVVAEHRGKLPKFFKRYQIQPVWRADRPARGRFREFYQCDVDAIGSRSMVVEAELCAAVSDVLQRLGFSDFSLRLNHRGLLRGILENAGLEENLHDRALISLDKLDKIGPSGVAEDMAKRGISAESAGRLLEAFAPQGAERGTGDPVMSNDIALSSVARHVGSNPAGLAAIEELREITRLCAVTSARPHAILDPSLARGLSYYTGAIMEIAVHDLPGSLGGGGRYDGLIGMFLGENIPACGFSLGLERILVVMNERNMFPPSLQASAVDAMVTLFEGEPVENMLQLAAALRSTGLQVELYPEPDKLGKQFKYAASRGIRFVLVMGADERERQQVTIKNLETGEQVSVARRDATRFIAESSARTTSRNV